VKRKIAMTNLANLVWERGYVQGKMDGVIGRTDAAIFSPTVRFVDGTIDMQSQWILSSTALPGTGKPVYFLLLDRSVPMHGIFANGVFHAHWADYGAERVESWCVDEATTAPIEQPKATMAGRFLRTLKHWSHASEGTALVHSARKERT
jgi:hypothetical protein